MAHDETICAIATPLGIGGIGIVRISGPAAVAAAGRVLTLTRGAALTTVQSHRLYRASLLFPAHHQSHCPESPSQSTAPSDAVLVAVMRGPHSFTGEDVVEIQGPGNPLLLRRLCNMLVDVGLRMAEPGEFTKRAFLNGRLDLAQAEGVLDTIAARTEEGLRCAAELASGTFSAHLRGMQEQLVGLLAHVEAGIDFVEEDLSFVDDQELRHSIESVLSLLSKLLETWTRGRMIRDGAKVVILGKPNVGKSSLLNALAQCDRAIVTPIAGTTRDVVEVDLALEGIPVRLVDTAGIRPTSDVVEQEGVRRSHAALAEADLAIVVVDGSAPLDGLDRDVVTTVAGHRHIVVLNKSDCPEQLTSRDRADLSERGAVGEPLRLSAQTGQGLNELQQAVIRHLVGNVGEREGLTITHLRHYEALRRAQEAALSAQAALAQGLTPEFLAVDLRAAASALGEVAGGFTTDDLLDAIFSRFCIGK